MRKNYRSKRSRSRHAVGQKPRGSFQERVTKVGPERFAIVSVDCGKAEAKTRVADFFGEILLAPFSFPISRPGLNLACTTIRQTLKKGRMADCVCVIESTGRYHQPVKTVLQQQSWDTRLVHPYTTSMIRRSANLGEKTDDVDLEAIHRAAMDGLAMRPEVIDSHTLQWRLLSRHRRDLVEKAATLKIQLKETIEAYLPGYTRQWTREGYWESRIASIIATTFPSAEAILEASVTCLRQAAQAGQGLLRQPTIDRIRAWARQAGPADHGHQVYFRRAGSLWRDLEAKQREIGVLELDLADFLCHSPCVLLLAFPGISIVSASDYGAELGPITNYATSKSIAGRAGLYPSRYQSCDTDRANGPLVARRNRKLRAALMRIARNLNRSNDYFMAQAMAYRERQHDRDAKVVIAVRFSRLSYYLIAGGRLPTHPAIQDGAKILQKLLSFYHERAADGARVTTALSQAIGHLSGPSLRAQQEVLAAQGQPRRRRGVRRLAEILPEVLLRIEQRLQEDPEESETQTQTIEPNHEDWAHGS